MEKINIIDSLDYIENTAFKPLFEILINRKFNTPIPKENYINAYTKVIKICEDKYKVQVYDYMIKKLSEYTSRVTKKLDSVDEDNLISEFLIETELYKIFSNWIVKVFDYIDRYYLKDNKMDDIKTTCLTIYKNNFLITIKDKLYNQTINLVNKHRELIPVDITKIKKVIDVFSYVDYEKADLIRSGDEYVWLDKSQKNSINKKRFIPQTLKEYYNIYFEPVTIKYTEKKFKEKIAIFTSSEYSKYAKKYLSEEDERKNILFSNTNITEKIDETNKKIIIDDVSNLLAEKDFDYLLRNEKHHEIKEIFELLKISDKKDTYKYFINIFDNYIKEEGKQKTKDKEILKDPKKIIPIIIEFKKNIDDIVDNYLQKNIYFQDTKNKAFSYLLNEDRYNKLLAFYADYEMRTGVNGLKDNQINDRLDNIINIFRCINSKLSFKIEYAKSLSNRLIQGKSISILAEKSLVGKLKTEAGISYVDTLSTILQDYDSNNSEMAIFREQTHKGSPYGFEIKFQVLQSGSWQVDKNRYFDMINIPISVLESIKTYKEFYLKRHKTHKLIYYYGLFNCEIQFLNLKRQYQVTASLMQYVIILLLEKYSELSIEDLMSLLGVTDLQYLINECNGLFCHPMFNNRKLSKSGFIKTSSREGNEITKKEEIIFLNNDFSSNNLKLTTIPVSIKTSNDDTRNKDYEKTYMKNMIDAAIVRILKGRIGQITTHAFLIGEVVKQLDQFRADPPLIKERIEHLIENCHIRRQHSNRNNYEYIA